MCSYQEVEFMAGMMENLLQLFTIKYGIIINGDCWLKFEKEKLKGRWRMPRERKATKDVAWLR